MIEPKSVVYGLLRALRLPALARRRDRAAVFCFHNVIPDELGEQGDASLHVRLASFRAIVDFIDYAFDVIPLAELASRVSAGRSLRGVAAITFDDAYAGVFTHALPMLAARHLPSTVFVVPEKSDEPSPFWWDQLATGGALEPTLRETCLFEKAGDERLIMNGRRGAASAPMLPASWYSIRQATGPVSIGSHTLRHLNLTRLPADDLVRDLTASRERLRNELGVDTTLLSYPYGLVDDGVVRAAAAAGYTVGATMKYGLATRGTDPLALPRVNVPANVGVESLDSWSVGWRLRKPA